MNTNHVARGKYKTVLLPRHKINTELSHITSVLDEQVSRYNNVSVNLLWHQNVVCQQNENLYVQHSTSSNNLLVNELKHTTSFSLRAATPLPASQIFSAFLYFLQLHMTRLVHGICIKYNRLTNKHSIFNLQIAVSQVWSGKKYTINKVNKKTFYLQNDLHWCTNSDSHIS